MPQTQGSFGKCRACSVGIVVAMVLSSCGGNPAQAPKTIPSATPSPSSWAEDLTLSGEINGRATTTVPDSGGTRSSCSGRYSGASGYALVLTLSTDHGVFQLFANINSYSGPGTYTQPGARINAGIINPDRTSEWTSAPDDPVVVTVNQSQESGSVDATLSLHNHETATVKETVKGRWTCHSGS